MNGGWQEVLTDPRSFFERRGEDPSLRGPVLIVGTIAVLGTIGSVLTFQALSAFVTEDARNMLAAAEVFAAVIGLMAPFVVWLLYAVVFYVVSIVLDGEGSFRDVALLSAWGFLPRVVGALLSLVGTAVATRQVSVEQLTSPEEFRVYANAVASHPANVLASAVGVVLLLWSAYIWVAALQESRQLDRGQARIAVAVPVGIALLFRLFGLLGALV